MGRNIRRIASWRDRHVGRKAGTYIDRQADRQVHISTRRQTGKAKKQGREARQGGKTGRQDRGARQRDKAERQCSQPPNHPEYTDIQSHRDQTEGEIEN